jgi:hypothetical protein
MIQRENLLLLCSLLFCIALLETVPRISPTLRPFPQTYVGDHKNRPNESMEADPQIGWKMRPNVERPGKTAGVRHFYVSNPQGFRSPLDFDAPLTRPNVAMVGDSFTFGYGVDEPATFTALLNRDLPHATFYNYGMPGFGLDQMWLTARYYALPRKPSLMVVTMISENFVRSLEAFRETEGWNKPVFRLDGGRLLPRTAADRPNALVRFLDEHSVIYRLGKIGSRLIGHYLPHGEWWNLNTAILDQIRAEAKANDVPVLFVFLPTRHWRSFPALGRFMAERHWNYLDLSDDFIARYDSLYIPGDGHINEAGHREVEMRIRAWIHQNMPGLE